MRTRVPLFILLTLLPLTVLAQNRTFVASTGLDTNPCSRTQPCRSFNTAVTAVVADGEVIVLDSAGYGQATISKGVSITAPAGIYAGVTVTSGDGFVLNAPGAAVGLKGLVFNNLGGTTGISQSAALAELHVDACSFRGFNAPGASGLGGGAPLFTVRDCDFRDNDSGLFVSGGSAAINGCRFDGNRVGAFISNAHATIRDSIFYSGDTGLQNTAFSNDTQSTVENCIFSGLTTGVGTAALPNDTSTVRLSATTLVNNVTAMAGNIVSFGNNRFDGNGSDGTFTSTIPLK
jgi:hypothetical protein